MNRPPTLRDLRRWLTFWQRELHLTHWGITIEFSRYHEMSDGALGHVEHKRRVYAARIYVLHPADLHPQAAMWSIHSTAEEGYEAAVVHELLHLSLAAWDPDEDSAEETEHEQAIELLARTLVNLRRARVPD